MYFSIMKLCRSTTKSVLFVVGWNQSNWDTDQKHGWAVTKF